jgi:hypothetical protein
MMRRCAILILSLLLPFQAAEAMRCGNDLVREGMTRYEVRERCGEPDDISRRYKTVYRHVAHDRTVAVEVEIEEWFYDGGSNRLDRLLRFVNGRLVREDVGR